ncbi:hypothetical protein LTR66_003938, partial [Elasticomyces elasticus]
MVQLFLTGATGFVGSEVLQKCLRHPAVRHIVVLTRKALPLEAYGKQRTKVTEIVHDDFEKYPDGPMQKLAALDVDSCIWCLGGKATQFPDLETAQRVGISYTHSAAEAIAAHLGPGLAKRGKKFRFVYCSAWGAEPDQT